MSLNKNLGVATPRVRILDKLPHIVNQPQKFNFDVSAFQWAAITNSEYYPPLLIENIINPERTFAVCHPSKRKYFVDNMLKHSDKAKSAPSKTIFWTPVGKPEGLGIINSHLEGKKKLPYYSEKEDWIPILDAPVEGYEGPVWLNKTYKEQAAPNDRKILKKWREFIQKELKTSVTELPTLEEDEDPDVDQEKTEKTERDSVYQDKVKDGLWWGIESNNFVEKNMPFWITLEIPPKPPGKDYETFYIISLGIKSGKKNRYDLVLSPTKKPQLVDYYGTKGGGEGDATIRDFDVSSSRLGFDTGRLDIGFMNAGGRLIIFVNDSTLVYSRIFKEEGEEGLKEADIAAGPIRVYGTNTTANIYAYPMTFARQGAMSFPIATKKVVSVFNENITDDNKERKTKIIDIEYSAADAEGNPTQRPVVSMPTNKSVTSRHLEKWGIDCESFKDANSVIEITDSFGLHREGFAEFSSTDQAKSQLKFKTTNDFYILFLTCQDREDWLGSTIVSGKPPLFFNLKGVDEVPRDVGEQRVTNATNDVLSITENASAPDYFHIKKSATVTLYNENGTYDFLKGKQHGIQIDWSWNNSGGRKPTFTGIIIGHDTNEIPGKETITLKCEDYNHILESTPIINSPFYDGMIGYHVIKDLAQRAGIEKGAFVKEWEDDTEYFLPSGYSFTAPKMRFKSRDKLFECIIDIAKRFEAFVYFDGSGKFHIAKLPGGLLGPSPDTISAEAQFSSDPNTPYEIILDQRDIGIDFSSTFNQINCLTLERDTRNPIVIGITAGASNTLTFKKEYLIDQPAYGDREVARVHLNALSQRVFFPIRKMSFKTTGSDIVLQALDFVTVDGIPFRVVSISRNFNAESNDYTSEYQLEWLNGK